MAEKITTKTFIEKAIEKHGNKYIYDKVNYNSSHEKVTIICPLHGSFYQKACAHLVGNGCIKCSGKEKMNIFSFLEKSKIKHGYSYNYDKTNYINNSSKVIITCLEHGDFTQTPNSHLSGSGCPLCFGKNRLNNDIFTKKSKEIHGNKYDYFKVNYVNNSSKVIITCLEHGDFTQTPGNHLSGQNCPKCKVVIKLDTENFIKKSEI